MKIPFSIDEFLHVFERYNQTLWPVQVLIYLLALVVIASIIRESAQSNRIVFIILAFFWLWMGVVYHILYFSSINKAAFLFGAVFALQGIIFFYTGAIQRTIEFKFEFKLPQVLGMLFVVYALLVYPILSYFGGHVYPQAPTFGVPCPTTIFTLGVLLFATRRVRWFVLLIPLLWSVVGFSAAMNLGIKEDFGLVVAGLLAAAIQIFYYPRGQVS